MHDEPLMDIPKVEAPPVNIKKASIQELKDTTITSNNVDTVTRELLRRDTMVMLKINSTERDKHAVFVGLNGRCFNIPRDQWVKVPAAIAGVLDEAKITEYHVKMDPTKHDQAEVTPHEVQRFATSTKPVEEPTPAPAAAPAKATVK